MLLHRRTFAAIAASATFAGITTAADSNLPMIIDTHQHLWDLTKFKLPWLGDTGPLARSFVTKDYLEAIAGFDVQAVYMEVDVSPEQRLAEAEYAVELTRDKASRTVAAVVGANPGDTEFAQHVAKLKKMPQVKGVRQVLHGDLPQGACLEKPFARGVQLLGDQGLSFDLCMRPAELGDGLKLAKLCPQTRFVVDHCGNADPKAFLKTTGDVQPDHNADSWRRSMDELAKQSNVICKISGIIARVPQKWSSETLAPIVNHCLDAFGPERVVFGSDWPVCLLSAPLRSWINALAEIIANRPAEEQQQLWHVNATRFYSL